MLELVRARRRRVDKKVDVDQKYVDVKPGAHLLAVKEIMLVENVPLHCV